MSQLLSRACATAADNLNQAIFALAITGGNVTGSIAVVVATQVIGSARHAFGVAPAAERRPLPPSTTKEQFQ